MDWRNQLSIEVVSLKYHFLMFLSVYTRFMVVFLRCFCLIPHFWYLKPNWYLTFSQSIRIFQKVIFFLNLKPFQRNAFMILPFLQEITIQTHFRVSLESDSFLSRLLWTPFLVWSIVFSQVTCKIFAMMKSCGVLFIMHTGSSLTSNYWVWALNLVYTGDLFVWKSCCCKGFVSW